MDSKELKMTTKLEAINEMLACVGQSPLDSLEGTKSYFTMTAENILESENKRVQLFGWDFNTEEHYRLTPDVNGIISVADDMLSVKDSEYYRERYVIRKGKLYDKLKHTFTITEPIDATVIFCFDYEELPEAARIYIKMSAAYKFCKKELGSDKACQYTQEDLVEAYWAMQEFELSTGNYNILNEFYDGTIRSNI